MDYLKTKVRVIHAFNSNNIIDPRKVGFPMSRDVKEFDVFAKIFSRYGRKREKYVDDLIQTFGGTIELAEDNDGRYMMLKLHILVDDLKEQIEKIQDYCLSKDLRFHSYLYETLNELGDAEKTSL